MLPVRVLLVLLCLLPGVSASAAPPFSVPDLRSFYYNSFAPFVVSPTHPFQQSDVGSYFTVVSGIGWIPGSYKIGAIGDSHSALLDRSPCSSVLLAYTNKPLVYVTPQPLLVQSPSDYFNASQGFNASLAPLLKVVLPVLVVVLAIWLGRDSAASFLKRLVLRFSS